MILYLLKSGLCLLVALVFYKCLLENEKMHRFNRVFLLGSLGFSLLIPFLSFDVQPEVVPFTDVAPVHFIERGLEGTLSQVTAQPQTDDPLVNFGRFTYWLITTLLLARFGRNMYLLFRKTTCHPTVPFGVATLVLIPQNGLPYTFLHYLFVDQTAYENRAIEAELFAHELAHIRQRHSFDILLIELLTCFFWFNPVFFWYKRAIRLNHEFLADQAVLNRCPGVIRYQHLLLSKLSASAPVLLTSTLTFQTTKQRFRMMTKQTSPARALTVALSSLFLFVGLAFAVSTLTVAVAQVAPNPAKPKVASQQPGTNVSGMERLYGDKFVLLPGRTPSQKAVRKKFSELSAEEKTRVQFIPPLPRLVPTDALLTDWKNAKKYGIWIDDKRMPNDRLNNYTAQNFGSYSISKLERNAINYGKHYFQIDLMTEQHYAAYLKESAENPLLILRSDLPKAR